MTWTYEQATGRLLHNGHYVWTGYSGLDNGKNNPSMQDVHGVGPIPRGKYLIGSVEDDHPSLGLHVMALIPKEGTETFGRGDFFMHGDNETHPGCGSHGCIVKSPKVAREQVSTSDDKDLEVV